jgi:hypothetical protein
VTSSITMNAVEVSVEVVNSGVKCMVMGSNRSFRAHQWWCSAWSWVRLFVFWGINGCVVHGRGFESLTFWGQWWCSAWSWVRVRVNGGVVHVVGSNLCLFGVINGGVVHGLGFEFLSFGGSMVV